MADEVFIGNYSHANGSEAAPIECESFIYMQKLGVHVDNIKKFL
jgi:hypothetical protein